MEMGAWGPRGGRAVPEGVDVDDPQLHPGRGTCSVSFNDPSS